MPDDILAAFEKGGIPVPETARLRDALEEPLNRMLDESE